jgi:iron complex outermembrane receptor protein/vitamin B12 transporter
LSRVPITTIIVLIFIACAAVCTAASIRGVVTDPSGAKVTGATVSVLSNGKVIATAVSTADGSFQVLTGTPGRLFLVVSAKSFRQIETPGFYAGLGAGIDRGHRDGNTDTAGTN